MIAFIIELDIYFIFNLILCANTKQDALKCVYKYDVKTKTKPNLTYNLYITI